jgi:hypothetical protein
MTNPTDCVEIITSVQRRRRWTASEKVRMVENIAIEASVDGSGWSAGSGERALGQKAGLGLQPFAEDASATPPWYFIFP